MNVILKDLRGDHYYINTMSIAGAFFLFLDLGQR